MMRLRIALTAFLTLFAVLCGCGYHFGGETDQLPGGVKHLYVTLFDNRTPEAFLENLVTNRVIEKFARTGKITIVEDRNAADGILTGIISNYGRSAVAYNPRDSIIEYRSRVKCAAELRRVEDNSVLWKGTVSWDEEFIATVDREMTEDREALVQEAIAQRLADELYARLTENF